jgi:DNA-binding transcriptional MerR regulator
MFTQKQINKIFKHIPSRTLLAWAEAGALSWTGESFDGRGRGRLYNEKDLYRVALTEELASLGFPLDVIAAIKVKHWDKLLAIEKQVPGRSGMMERQGFFMFFDIDPAEPGPYRGFMATGTYSTVILNLPALVERVESLIKEAKAS